MDPNHRSAVSNPKSMPGARVAALARGWIGTPYHHQAAAKGAGADCLGLVRGIWAELYGTQPGAYLEPVPRYTPDWGEYGGKELLLEGARRNLVLIDAAAHGLTLPPARRVWEPGFVLLFRVKPNAVAKHCGIVTGPDAMVHAYSGIGVAETAIGVWAACAVAIFGFPRKPRE